MAVMAHGGTESELNSTGDNIVVSLPRATVDDDMPAFSRSRTPAVSTDAQQDMASPSRQGPDAHGGRSLVFSNDTAASCASNAFEGALDGLDFGMEPFGVDSWSWPPNDQSASHRVAAASSRP